MRARILALLAILGLATGAHAQAPLAGLPNVLGGLTLSETGTGSADLSLTDTVLSLNETVADLHTGLSAGTPLVTNRNFNGAAGSLIPLATRPIDATLSGNMTEINRLSITRLLTTLPAGLPVAVATGTTTGSGTASDPQVLLTIIDAFWPFETLVPPPSNTLAPVAMLAIPAGEQSFGPVTDALEPVMFQFRGGLLGPLSRPVALLLADAGSGIPVLGDGLLSENSTTAGDDQSPGLPFDTTTLPLATALTALSGGGANGGGLPVDALPLPLDALDASTATALLSGAQLPGL